MPTERIKTVTQVLASGNVAEFYSKGDADGVVCYWTVNRSCGCRLSGRATNSADAFTRAGEQDAAHEHG